MEKYNNLSKKDAQAQFKIGLKVDPILHEHSPSYEEMDVYFRDTFSKLRAEKLAYAKHVKKISDGFSLNEVQIFLCMNGAHIKLSTHPLVKQWSEYFLKNFEKLSTTLEEECEDFSSQSFHSNLFSFLSHILEVNRDDFCINSSLSNYKSFKLNDDRTILTALKQLTIENNGTKYSEFTGYLYDISGNLIKATDEKGNPIQEKKREEISR